jgi:predicted nucleotidyltransferase
VVDGNPSNTDYPRPVRGPEVPFPEIIRAEVGSTIHGVGKPGHEDRDEMGVCIEDASHVIGLENFEQYIYRTAKERTGKQDAKSLPGDLDLTVYSLRKYLRLAVKGNPSVLLLLYVPEDRLVVQSALGKELQALAPSIAARSAGTQFLGFLTAQKQRLLKERGTSHVPNRSDGGAKYAAHMLRLGYQGIEFLTTGRITLPMPEPEREIVYRCKMGEMDYNQVLNSVGQMEYELRDLLTTSPLQETPDREVVNDFLVSAYTRRWDGHE